MNTTFLTVVGIVVGAIVLIPLIIALVLGYFVASKSRSRKMAEEQASLNKKTGASDETPATTASKRSGSNDEKWYIKYVWSILVIVVGAWLVYWGFQNTQIRPADAGSWSWAHWLPLLIIWGILSVLIALNRKVLGDAAKVLQTVLAIAMVGALVVLPLAHAIWGESSSSQQAQQQARPVVTMPANGDSVHVDQKVGYILIFTGSGFEHHVVYTGGRDCIVGNTKDPCQEGPILYQYVRDTTGKPNSATYRFVL